MPTPTPWQIHPIAQVPDWMIEAIRPYLPELSGQYAAQLLWQRGIRQPDQLAGFIDASRYQPASPFAIGDEMTRAVARLRQAWQSSEQVAIWGDFDADGVTATAVLWEGLGEFFPVNHQLTYFIPNRLLESHGLSMTGIKALADWGCSLIVTCDTGSTNHAEIVYARRLGIDVIVTDHHTLPLERPPVTAILNPRALPSQHLLANLSGVAVAYKLVEALYETLPDVPQRPLDSLLDLVAIGLIADLVKLTGDCRYLAQVGIACLQKNQDPVNPPRPGIAKLLELCRRNGDRPTDISLGLGPRINAISRIQGDARFCVELLTSRDRQHCHQLALETELANARRKALQRGVMQDVKQKLAQLDLSTTRAIILADPQWPIGILGLVAAQIAQEYGRPTILLSTAGREIESGTQFLPEPFQPETEQPFEEQPFEEQLFEETEEEKQKLEEGEPEGRVDQSLVDRMARGSARSVNQIDLYALLQQQSHLLHRFGGHPLAAGLILPIENIPLLTQAINQQLRLLDGEDPEAPVIQADLEITVAELGQSLFQELKLLEPYGMGNPVPKLLIQNCWFTRSWHRKIQDLTKHKLEYIKTEFEICDDSCPQGFPGIWWGHYKDELPSGRCDAIVELDFNSYEDAKRKKRYEVRLLQVRAADIEQSVVAVTESSDWLLDWRGKGNPEKLNSAKLDTEAVLPLTTCPSSWQELYAELRQARQMGRQLALAYAAPVTKTPVEIWQQLVGAAKYLSRTGKTVTQQQLQEKLRIGDCSLQLGWNTLKLMGFDVTASKQGLRIVGQSGAQIASNVELTAAIEQFSEAVKEEQFMQQFFCQVPLATIQTAVNQMIRSGQLD